MFSRSAAARKHNSMRDRSECRRKQTDGEIRV